MPVPKEIQDLVKKFGDNFEHYQAAAYKEEDLRSHFLNPMFQALGWDMEDRKGLGAYSEVRYEEQIKSGAPDYGFWLEGKRRFFVEAKNPSLNICNHPKAALQLRAYGWSAGLARCVLTDFEEFSVYDTTVRPKASDKASVARLHCYKYQEFEEKWDEIASLFSREAVLAGALDKLTPSRGSQAVDDGLLKDISEWRELLAKNIALRNRLLTEEQVSRSVQDTLDRMMFLRICEDREIEVPDVLKQTVEDSKIYPRLLKVFERAEKRYDSSLFEMNKTPELMIDDKVLETIISELYFPKSPYKFDAIPADILGQVYEQFLGKVIRLTKDHHAKVEEKPEVRKAGGVYYTPTYIVDYIVRNTVGRLLDGKSPKDLKTLSIVDPACGSGSFLIGAYQFLLDWYRDWYASNNAEKNSKGGIIYRDKAGKWQLHLTERRRILVSHIYGVDIDRQAVEVAKLSLMLKALEAHEQRNLLDDRMLPNLASNIKCGNSLVGTDFFSGQVHVEPAEMSRINPFDWTVEFQEIFEHGGFDIVIGNPPYVRQEILGSVFKNYAKKSFVTYAGAADLYTYFIERAHKILKPAGLFSFIVSNKFMRANYGRPLRGFLVDNSSLIQVVDFGELPVFEKASTFPVILVTSNQVRNKQHFTFAAVKRLDFSSLTEEVRSIGKQLDQSSLSGESWTLVSSTTLALLNKIKTKGIRLGEYVNDQIYYGIKTGFDEAFVIDSPTRDLLIKEDTNSSEIIKPYVIGDDIRKYRVNFKNRFVIFTRRGIEIEKYPAVYKYLLKNKDRLTPKPKNWKGEKWEGRKPGPYAWYEIQDTVNYWQEFEKNKIVWPEIAKESRFAFDNKSLFFNKTSFICPVEDKYLLGLLNSKVVWFFLKNICAVLGDADEGGRLLQQKIYIELIPIPKMDFEDKKDKSLHSEMVNLVEEILSLHQHVSGVNAASEQTALQRQIISTDFKINQLTYKIYGLTDAEIRIIEGG